MAQHRIAFIQARWHSDLVDNCRESFLSELATLRPDAQVDTFMVPGALEIPLRAKLLADTGDYDAIVTAGLVVDGGIYRHEFVASAVIDGLVRVGLDTGVPVGFGLLTCDTEEQAIDRAGLPDSREDKGREAVEAALSTWALLRRVG